MKCFVAKDDCEICVYNQNALLLHGLHVETISADALTTLNEQDLDAPLIICHSLFSLLSNPLKIKNIILSGPSPIDKKLDLSGVTYLQVPYRWHDLFNIIAKMQKADPVRKGLSDKLIGTSEQIVAVRNLVNQVARSKATVLLSGESGSGKDVIASSIHALSDRKHKPFVPVNCGAIPSDLIESELFGHVKGAFTGAMTTRIGRFEMADGGTIFLDEIGDMPLDMQVKLLRVLQDQVIQKVGGNDSKQIDVRIIAASHKNLEQLVQAGTFREDLYYRINVFPIHVPSLRERKEDIPELSEYWIDIISERLGKKAILSKKVYEAMARYSWPGNVRELQNFLERIMILYPDRVVSVDDVAPYLLSKQVEGHDSFVRDLPEHFDIKEYIANIEKAIIQKVIDKSNGVISQAASLLNISTASLSNKIKKLDIQLETSHQ